MDVLILHDHPANLRLLEVVAYRACAEATVRLFQDPLEALESLSSFPADLVVLDAHLPGMDGLDFVRRFRCLDGATAIPVVMLVSASERSLRPAALELGVDDFLAKPLDLIEVRTRLSSLLALREARLLLGASASQLGAEIRSAIADIELREDELVRRLCQAAEHRDPETGGHLQRMARYTGLLASRMGFDPVRTDQIRKAASMHDIGKVGISDSILLKPGILNADEMMEMRKHAEFGEAILDGSTSDLLRLGCLVAGTHHERWDGTGYPLGLAREEIPLVGRIVAVADVFDALTSRRSYKEPWSLERARRYLQDESGGHFDPRCVEAFLAAWEEILAVHDSVRDIP